MAQHTLAGMWGSAPHLEGTTLLFFYFLITCGKSLFAGPASAKQLSLPCPSWLCAASWQVVPYPGSVHCSFMHRNTQVCYPRECLEQGRCCSWGQGAQIHHSSPPLPECRLSHELGGAGTLLTLHTWITGGAGTLLTLHTPDALGYGSFHCPPVTVLPPLRTTIRQGTGVPVLPSNTRSLQVVWM